MTVCIEKQLDNSTRPWQQERRQPARMGRQSRSRPSWSSRVGRKECWPTQSVMMITQGARRVHCELSCLAISAQTGKCMSYAEDEARGTEHDSGPEGGGGLGAVVLHLLEVRGAAAVLGVLALGLGVGGRGVCVHERQKLWMTEGRRAAMTLAPPNQSCLPTA